MSELYRLVYTSRNLLEGSEAERAEAVAQILATSQANNARVGVTGALLFNGGSFAQVLEGPRLVIETTFERIQRDWRHSDVNVLGCEPAAERGFPNWSMAFVGQSDRGRALWSEMASRTGFDLSRIEGEDLYATLHAIVLAEEDLAGQAAPPARQAAAGATAVPRAEAGPLDTERLRAELRDASPEERQPRTAGSAPPGGDARAIAVPRAPGEPNPEVAILRQALAEERARTTELRRDMDNARIALAAAEQQIATLRHQRDTWAGRTRSLATLLAQDADDARLLPHGVQAGRAA